MMRTTPWFLRTVFGIGLLGLGLLGLALPSSAVAEEDAPVPGPRDLEAPDRVEADEEAAGVEIPWVPPGAIPLLPIDDMEWLVLQREHPTLVQGLQAQLRRAGRLEERLAKARGAATEATRKLHAEMARTRAALQALWRKALPALAPHGVDVSDLHRVAQAPRGVGHVARYAHALVLTLELRTDQHALFERVVPQVNAAWFTLSAQKKRLQQVTKQASLETDARQGVLRSVDQQLRLIDKRFWHLVDFVLDDDQRHALKERLPRSYQKVQNAVEHLYLLPDLEPAQASRIRALLTAVEAEIAPEQALVRRNREALKAGGVAKADNLRLQQESRDANRRIQDHWLHFARATKAVLTDAQYRAYKSIPPQLSHNDRRVNMQRLFEGVTWTPHQRDAMKALQRGLRAQRKALQKRAADLRREQGDYGPDSPQMEMMQTEMAAVGAAGAALQRQAIGRILLEVMRPDQVTAWALTLTGWQR